jgi:DNA-directed RNA polymerase specialized sigma24 family protein
MQHQNGKNAPMTTEGSVTHLVGQLQAGDATAAQALFERYFEPMVRLARARRKGKPGRDADEEDVALSAFDSFCRGAKDGKFPQLTDRDQLWRLLVVITSRKAADQLEHGRRVKRGGGAVRGESAFAEGGSAADERGIERVAGAAPTPDFAILMADEFDRLLGLLPDDTLRAVALWRMEGFSNEQIAAKLGCVVRTVERKVRLIHTLWQEYRDGKRHDKE